MNVVIIIQARLGSTRLPGKVLMDIEGQSMLERVVSRAAACRLASRVLVATSTLPGDDPIELLCAERGWACFRGDEANVLDRYAEAARTCAADAVVRITSDCPLIDPEVSDRVIEAFLKERPDYASNVLERAWPRGLDTEVFTAAALERARREATQDHERLHVTPYIHENPQLFRLLSVRGEIDHSGYRWTVDTPEDLELVRAVYRRLGVDGAFHWRDVLALMQREPDLARINAGIRQKTREEG